MSQSNSPTLDVGPSSQSNWSLPQMVFRYMHTSEERDAHVASGMDRLAEIGSVRARDEGQGQVSVQEIIIYQRLW